MSFFWVNLGKSYNEVATTRFLWAPQYTFNKSGTRIVSPGWKHVPKAHTGDIFFCAHDGILAYVGVATRNAYPSPRPENKIHSGWEKEGYRIDIDLEILETPLTITEFNEEFISLYNDRTEPLLFTAARKLSQQYMVSLPDIAGAYLLDLIGDESIDIQKKVSDAEGSKPEVETQKSIISQARVGQGKFKKNVLKLWDNRCPVTGIERPELLIGSHILSWQLSKNHERLDNYNGLPLAVHVDKLFDRGLISFKDDGTMIHKPGLEPLLEQLGLKLPLKIKLFDKNIGYMRRHRENHNFSNASEIGF